MAVGVLVTDLLEESQGEKHAQHRSLAHASYHVGQMAYIGKMIRGEEWTYLSIPPGGSAAYNERPVLEKGPGVPRP